MAQIVELPLPARETRAPSATARADRPVHSAEVYVLFTSFDETLAALRVAGHLAGALDSTVRLVDFRVVPVGAPVEAPTGRSPLETDRFLDRLSAESPDVRANVYVCRDIRSAIPLVFKDHSMILIGARRHWWPTRADRLRRMLEARGHFVLLVDEARKGRPGTGQRSYNGVDARRRRRPSCAP